jgi:alkylation response protein AidB-like acyl-CoA dehydrogenase
MEFNYPPAADAYRKKVCAFLDQHLPAGWKGIGALNREEAAAFTDAWRETLRDNGFLAVNWPKEYGGQGLTSIEAAVISEEFARVGVPTVGPSDMFGISMLGNTLLAIGTEEQKKHYLPRVLSGEDLWCQGFSEPAAGSDLGNLGCRAVLVDH